MALGGIELAWIAAGAGALLVLLAALVTWSSGRRSKRSGTDAASRRVDAFIGGKSATSALRSDNLRKHMTAQSAAPVSEPVLPRTTAPSAELIAPSFPEEGLQTQLKIASPQDSDSIIGNFRDKDAWASPGGGPAPAGLAGGGFAIGPMSGVISAASLVVDPAAIYVIDYTIRLIKPPRNGRSAYFVVGPMFMDESGAIFSWGSVERPLEELERSSRTEVVPPHGAKRVWLYLGGLWAAENPQPDGIVVYSKAALRVIKS